MKTSASTVYDFDVQNPIENNTYDEPKPLQVYQSKEET